MHPEIPSLDDHPGNARRIALTVSCRDADELPKVPDAGSFRRVDGVDVQVMHNGIVVERDGYCGPWMTEIIRCLHGHHEPQEELVFSAILNRISTSEDAPSMIELGSWWAYYSLWFRRTFPQGRVIAMEPDASFLETGRRNFSLNRETALFVRGAIGPHPGELLQFPAESDGKVHDVRQRDVEGLMRLGHVGRLSLLLADIQGMETTLMEQIRPLIACGGLRFLVVSTHHHVISGDPLTHQKVLEAVASNGGHVIAEHSVGESFSGDGLVAASFCEGDSDLVVEVSRCRQRDSLFGELEPYLDLALARVRQAEAAQGELAAENAELRRQIVERLRKGGEMDSHGAFTDRTRWRRRR
jgi:FkbM family methyltransferase